ncbi:MAG: diphosphate--fructose-6-phosphate 1-phosphotransferase, partial [Spirochaetota bacterium]
MYVSDLQSIRYTYTPKLPPAIAGKVSSIDIIKGEPTESIADQASLQEVFAHTYGQPTVELSAGSRDKETPKRTVGVILSGGQAPGGHNVIAGLFDALKAANPDSTLLGFRGGPSGLLKNDAIEITADLMDAYRNTGGFDIIGSGRTKIESSDDFAQSAKVCREMKLDGLIIIGGDDSNTNAALLAEYFREEGVDTSVIGVPKTIDGDLRNEHIEASFGFDTATKTYSELIGNIGRDAASARKYWHFIRLMGRSASHIALECALQTHPNICVVSEEVEAQSKTLQDVVEQICESVRARASKDMNFGIVLIPEGLIEFIPEIKKLISAINDLLAHETEAFGSLESDADRIAFVSGHLDTKLASTFSSLPESIQSQLLDDRDPHGNVQVSRIETEKMLIEMVEAQLKRDAENGTYNGRFSGLAHFFGYEGRCAFPSNFDADYCYSLGYTAFLLLSSGLTGYIVSIRNIPRPATEWKAGGVPLTMLMNMEQRHGSKKPVIRKALVDLDGAPFREFASKRET